jgi:hypothetical protein
MGPKLNILIERKIQLLAISTFKGTVTITWIANSRPLIDIMILISISLRKDITSVGMVIIIEAIEIEREIDIKGTIGMTLEEGIGAPREEIFRIGGGAGLGM